MIQFLMFVAGCIFGVIGSYYVSKYFHAKSEVSQRVTNSDISDIKALVVSLQQNVAGNTFKTVAIPLLRSVHRYVSSMASLAREIKQLKKAGSNRKVQILVGEVEMFNENLSDVLSIGKTNTAEPHTGQVSSESVPSASPN
jgi:hypothetical protein